MTKRKSAPPPKPVQIIEIGEGATSAIALLEARLGNPEAMFHALESGTASAELQAFAEEWVTGKIRRQKKRPPRNHMELAQALLLPAMRVVELESKGALRKNAIADVAAELKCSKRKIETSLRFCKLTGSRKPK
jgi:hypothetical protein